MENISKGLLIYTYMVLYYIVHEMYELCRIGMGNRKYIKSLNVYQILDCVIIYCNIDRKVLEAKTCVWRILYFMFLTCFFEEKLKSISVIICLLVCLFSGACKGCTMHITSKEIPETGCRLDFSNFNQ